MTGSALSPSQRQANIERFATETFDVAVIGGGVVGAGVALDAATRGLSVALLEARDYGSGTSSRSSKLIHGGLRYLEMLDFRLVREALRERTLLTKTIAPHLVRPLPFLFPIRSLRQRLYVGLGVAAYDVLATLGGRRTHIPRHRHLSRARTLKRFPALDPNGLKGAVEYYDAQVDDSRFVIALIRTATRHGAMCVSRAEVQKVERQCVAVVDRETGRSFEVHARNIVNATGVWSSDIEGLGQMQYNVRASKGVHLVVPRNRIEGSGAIIDRAGKSVLFVIPWEQHWIIGTTDTDWNYDKSHPSASKKDIDYLLHQANDVLSSSLTTDDVTGVYIGLRPLLSGDSPSTAKLSREHVVERDTNGVISVRGGKYTTYRVMAKDTVDMLTPVKCATEEVPVVGAVEQGDIDERLWRRYGSMTEDVLQLLIDSPELGEEITDGHIAAEFVYAVTHEGALHLEDLLTRRTHISVTTKDRGVDVAERVARLVAPHLGWTGEQITREVETYRARVAAERRSQEAEDDESADAARSQAPEIV